MPRKGIPLLPEHNPLATQASHTPPPTTTAPPPQAIAPPPVEYTPQPIDDRIVVIDPGHGGEHPGAVGHRRLKEKDICLQIGRKLAIKLNEQPGVTALLTAQPGDYNIALRDPLPLCRQLSGRRVHLDSYELVASPHFGGDRGLLFEFGKRE